MVYASPLLCLNVLGPKGLSIRGISRSGFLFGTCAWAGSCMLNLNIVFALNIEGTLQPLGHGSYEDLSR